MHSAFICGQTGRPAFEFEALWRLRATLISRVGSYYFVTNSKVNFTDLTNPENVKGGSRKYGSFGGNIMHPREAQRFFELKRT